LESLKSKSDGNEIEMQDISLHRQAVFALNNSQSLIKIVKNSPYYSQE